MRTGLYGRSGNGGSAGADLGRPLRHLGSVVFQHARQLVHHLAQSRNFAFETLCSSLDLVGARDPVAGPMPLPFAREQRQSAVGQHAKQSMTLQDHHAFGSSADPILLQGRTDRLRDIGLRAIANVRPQVAPISRIAQQGMAIGVEQQAAHITLENGTARSPLCVEHRQQSQVWIGLKAVDHTDQRVAVQDMWRLAICRRQPVADPIRSRICPG